MKQIVTIQYWRAIAAILVVIFHASIVTGSDGIKAPLFPLGQFGVDLFFVISGFIMWTLTAVRPTTPDAFISRRIIRIVPLYWLMTIITASVSNANALTITIPDDSIAMARSLFFLPCWNDQAGRIAPIMTIGWTLNLAMMFYALFAFSLSLRPRLRLATIVISLTGLVILGAIIAPQNAALALYSDSIIGEFALGVLLGAAYVKNIFPFNGKVPRAPLGAVCIAFALVWLVLHPQPGEMRLIAWGPAALALVTGGLLLEEIASRYAVRSLLFLGAASYAIYLSHVMVLSAVHAPALAVFRETGFAIGVLTVLCCLVGGALYWFVEKPMTSKTARIVRAVSAIRSKNAIAHTNSARP